MADEALDSSRIEAAKESPYKKRDPADDSKGSPVGSRPASPWPCHCCLFTGRGPPSQRRCCAWYFSCSPSFCLFSSIRQRAKVGSGRTLVRLAFDRIVSSPSVTRCGISKSSSTAQRCQLDGPDSRRAHDFAGVGGNAPDNRMDLPVVAIVSRLRLVRTLAAAALDPPGYGLDRLVGHMYMTLEGIFGVPSMSRPPLSFFSPSMAPYSNTRRQASSTSTFRSRRWAVSPREPAEP